MDAYRCPLCGRSFDFPREGCARSCPMGGHCNLICCPYCGYSFPKGSRIYTFFKRLFTRSPDGPERKENADSH